MKCSTEAKQSKAKHEFVRYHRHQQKKKRKGIPVPSHSFTKTHLRINQIKPVVAIGVNRAEEQLESRSHFVEVVWCWLSGNPGWITGNTETMRMHACMHTSIQCIVSAREHTSSAVNTGTRGQDPCLLSTKFIFSFHFHWQTVCHSRERART